MKNPSKSPGARPSRHDAAAPGPMLARFAAIFGQRAAAGACAPGRVNLIGEHIDYAGGTVLPIAINRGASVLVAPNARGKCRLFSREFEAQMPLEISLDAALPDRSLGWAQYPLGVARSLMDLGVSIPPFDLLVESDVPPGSGLSSSAALEVAAAAALAALAGAEFPPLEIARAACRAENLYAGVACGIMDQAASALCAEGCALRLRTSDLRHAPVSIPEGAAIIIAHCGVSRGLAATAYGQRRAELERAAAALSRRAGLPRPHLLDSSEDEFLAAAGGDPAMDATVARRARYAFAENARVARFVRALECDDLASAGRLMNESHFGLRDEYEVSCRELDELTAFARSLPAVFGSRLTGAGFGGCTVTLAAKAHAAAAIVSIEDFLRKALAVLEPLVFESPACAGARMLDL